MNKKKHINAGLLDSLIPSNKDPYLSLTYSILAPFSLVKTITRMVIGIKIKITPKIEVNIDPNFSPRVENRS